MKTSTYLEVNKKPKHSVTTVILQKDWMPQFIPQVFMKANPIQFFIGANVRKTNEFGFARLIILLLKLQRFDGVKRVGVLRRIDSDKFYKKNVKCIHKKLLAV